MVIGVNSNPPELYRNINFDYKPETVQDAVEILRHTFLNDKNLYNALIASISSALKELPKESDLEDVSKRIAGRIIGEE